ncbi:MULTISPECIES: DEAD/DEAH box helicase [Pseudomonas]|uniref:DEAD/DEAH box helicase n=1 Tax=Pseudomonas TaxID=286 RepID=UPI00070C091E|nr:MULTISPECIES: AAA domain-containing protein [Pseudomonas]KQW09375.1 DNA helicase [Pseudomonas sp. Root401]WHS55507.1 AAA domain-containing protein [Pseudomonas brassicacearum]
MQGQHPLIEKLFEFVHAERDANLHQLLQTWQRPLHQKLEKGLTQGFTHLEKADKATCLWAYLDDSESRFREGDMLRLHLGDPSTGLLCARMTFEREEDGRWLLSEKLANTVWDNYQDGPCYADMDALDLTPRYEKTLEDIADSINADNIIVPLLGDAPIITFNDADLDYAESFAIKNKCNEHQARAVAMAFAAEQIACIQGPPGTGKTRALALIVQLLVERHERVFVTSHTHMAINNALTKIAERKIPTVKIGGRRDDLSKTVDWAKTPADWENLPADGSGYVIGATPFATCSQLEHFKFDTVIFDEASQITLPLALMAMRKGKRFIFIGDQKQLPPVLLSQSVLSGESMSIFGRLTSQTADHTVMLEETYRMNQWLTEWPSKNYYKGKLRAAGPNKERRFNYVDAEAPMDRVFDPDASAVFIPTTDRTAKTRNYRDAQHVLELCKTAQTMGLALSDIGIVTPYRAQGRAIRTLLARSFGREIASTVVADTVERMQGQERELIIVSLASGDEEFIGAVAEFFFQPERLNVSITRAMTKLIIIGPELSQGIECSNSITQQWANDYLSLVSRCRKVVLTP